MASQSCVPVLNNLDSQPFSQRLANNDVANFSQKQVMGKYQVQCCGKSKQKRQTRLGSACHTHFFFSRTTRFAYSRCKAVSAPHMYARGPQSPVPAPCKRPFSVWIRNSSFVCVCASPIKLAAKQGRIWFVALLSQPSASFPTLKKPRKR